jgi:excisionase family DNA binding protein
MSENLLTPAQVADRLAIRKRTVQVWLNVGKIKGVKVGRLWRVSEQDLEAFLKEGREAAETSLEEGDHPG